MKFLGKRKKKMDKLKLIKFNIVIFGMIAFVMLFSANAYVKNGFNKKMAEVLRKKSLTNHFARVYTFNQLNKLKLLKWR